LSTALLVISHIDIEPGVDGIGLASCLATLLAWHVTVALVVESFSSTVSLLEFNQREVHI
jgi:hypothetical protein